MNIIQQILSSFSLRNIDRFLASGLWRVICEYPDGSFKWEDIIRNTITAEGINYILDAGFHSGTPIAETSWFIGVISTSSPTILDGDTMASHSGWTEQQSYDEATRTAWGHGPPASKVVTNASPVIYTGSSGGPYPFNGLFLTSDNTKGGTTGTLWGGGGFSQGNKNLDEGEKINITYSVNGASG